MIKIYLYNLLLRLTKRFVKPNDISRIHSVYEDERQSKFKKEQKELKDQAEIEMFEFLRLNGANFQKELESQNFIAIPLPNNGYYPLSNKFTLKELREMKFNVK